MSSPGVPSLRGCAWLAVVCVGSGLWYQAPDFPLVDELPLVGQDGCARPETSVVACVLDGDTLDAGECGQDVGKRIRLLGVDAPEIEHAPDPAECWGNEAFEYLSELVSGHDVLLSYDQDPHCVDTYDRTLGYVWLLGDDATESADASGVSDLVRDDLAFTEDGPWLMVNEVLLATGQAPFYDAAEELGQSEPILWDTDLRGAAATAQLRGLGVWSACAESR